MGKRSKNPQKLLKKEKSSVVLVFNGDTYDLSCRYNGTNGQNYQSGSLMAVYNFKQKITLIIESLGISTIIDPQLVKLYPGGNFCAGMMIAIPLNPRIALHVYGVFDIDHQFVEQSHGTDQYEFIRNRIGEYAISAFGIQVESSDTYGYAISDSARLNLPSTSC